MQVQYLVNSFFHINIVLLGITPQLHDWLLIAEKFIWCGFAAAGFAVLFNVPVRTLALIAVLGGIGGLTKFSLIYFGFSDVFAPFCGSAVIGLLSIFLAHYKHTPPPVFYIPALIPMVPGVFAYRMMLGMIKLVGNPQAPDYAEVMNTTVNNGLKVLFIIIGLAVGVVIPMLVTRRSSVKDLKASSLFSRRDE
jgi:uncharacterized membrane protein YjjB (DUF3815 family)